MIRFFDMSKLYTWGNCNVVNNWGEIVKSFTIGIQTYSCTLTFEIYHPTTIVGLFNFLVHQNLAAQQMFKNWCTVWFPKDSEHICSRLKQNFFVLPE